MTAALEGGEWSAARPGRTLPPGKTRYPFYRRLGGPQDRYERAENLVFTGIRSRTVQPVVSRYTDWATQPTEWGVKFILNTRSFAWERVTQQETRQADYVRKAFALPLPLWKSNNTFLYYCCWFTRSCQRNKCVQYCHGRSKTDSLDYFRAAKYFILLSKIYTYFGVHIKCPRFL